MSLIPRWVWIVVAAVLALAGFQYWRSRGQDAKADADVAKSVVVDTQHKAQTDSSAKIDTAVAKIEVARKGALDAGKKALGDANKTHGQADTAGQHAKTVRDSLTMWRTRDSLHVAENASLRVVIQNDSSAIRSDSLQKILLTTQGLGWKADADSAVASQDRLRADLKVARAGCKIAFFVPCPNRLVAYGAGVVTGVLIAHNNIKLLSFHR